MTPAALKRGPDRRQGRVWPYLLAPLVVVSALLLLVHAGQWALGKAGQWLKAGAQRSTSQAAQQDLEAIFEAAGVKGPAIRSLQTPLSNRAGRAEVRLSAKDLDTLARSLGLRHCSRTDSGESPEEASLAQSQNHSCHLGPHPLLEPGAAVAYAFPGEFTVPGRYSDFSYFVVYYEPHSERALICFCYAFG